MALTQAGYSFQTYAGFIKNPAPKVVVLRHDVDLLPANSLAFAHIQHQLSIEGTYYFRAVPESWDETIIRKIAALGHEIGYHYENLTSCKGNLQSAIDDFEHNLSKLRKLVTIETICMHGSPKSKFDSKDLWKIYNYRNYGIIGEPYFDTDFSQVFYLTDTGRRWDGHKYSVRDKVQYKASGTKGNFALPDKLKLKSTTDIIHALHTCRLPEKLMFTFHPQRWSDKPLPWLKELVIQNLKNEVKRWFFVKK